MSELFHLIIRDTQTGFYATSPQAPGFMLGRPTVDELRADLLDALAFHFEEARTLEIVEHHERLHDLEAGELVTRLAADMHHDERLEVYTRIATALDVPEQVPELLGGIRNGVGEVVYVCAVPSDTLGWLFTQLDEQGDAFSVALAISELFLMTFPLTVGPEDGPDSSGECVTIGSRGYTKDTTLAEVMKCTAIVSPVKSVARVAC
ncbi:hypothetical protein ACIRL2_38360 [Embleya sp. NPDC127516]|uniref:hypothetical protein n=1 Tax=Embleya sp. NPDC127516 TaxID=3363990 RepID=UPI0037F4ECEB